MKSKSKKSRNAQHDFVLVLDGTLTRDAVDALFESGCDDATPSMRLGRFYLTFSRTAPTFKAAILSAIRDVERAGVRVVCVNDSNLVSQSDIARRINRTRQQVSQYVSGKRGSGDFPLPISDLLDGHPLWHWNEVARWLWKNTVVDETVLHSSRTIATINSILELRNLHDEDSKLVDEISVALKPKPRRRAS